MSEKKVIFSGIDSGASSTAHKIYSGIIADAQKYTNTIKEQNSYIKEQIKALEKKADVEAANLRLATNSLIKANKLAPGLEQQNARINAKRSINESKINFDEDIKALELLRGIYNESRKQTTASEKAEKSQQKKSITSEEQYSAMKSLARQEVKENLSGVKSKIKLAEKNDYSGLDPRTAEKLMYQKQIVGEDKKSSSTFGAVFAGTLAAGIVQQVASAMSKIVGATSGEQAVNSLLGSIPILGGAIGGGADRTFQEQLAIQTKELELTGRTGKSIKGLSNKSNIGFSTRESLSTTEGLITASGKSSGADSTSNALTLQRGLGLSPETISQILRDIRITRSSADIMQIVSDVLKANPELRKDQTKFSEILQQTSQLTSQLASQSENVDPRKNAGLVGALRSIGGSFADNVLGPQRMMSINSSLTSPGTEFQKARSFGVLSGQNPGMSYFQMLEAQEKGIGSKGYLGGTLKQLRRETGGGENFMLSAMQNLNLPASTSRKLVAAFERNPKMFDSFSGGSEDIEKVLGLSKRAETVTSTRDKQKAEIDNAFAISAYTGDIKVASMTMKVGAGMFKGAVDSFSNSIEKLVGLKTGSLNIFSMGLPRVNETVDH